MVANACVLFSFLVMMSEEKACPCFSQFQITNVESLFIDVIINLEIFFCFLLPAFSPCFPTSVAFHHEDLFLTSDPFHLCRCNGIWNFWIVVIYKFYKRAGVSEKTWINAFMYHCFFRWYIILWFCVPLFWTLKCSKAHQISNLILPVK